MLPASAPVMSRLLWRMSSRRRSMSRSCVSLRAISVSSASSIRTRSSSAVTMRPPVTVASSLAFIALLFVALGRLGVELCLAPRTVGVALGLARLVALVVGLDDAGDERVTHDVGVGEVTEAQAVDVR